MPKFKFGTDAVRLAASVSRAGLVRGAGVFRNSECRPLQVMFMMYVRALIYTDKNFNS